MAESKRSSSRTVVVSKAFKVVDSETRKEFRNKRIQTLEADNYNDVEPETQDEDDYEANVTQFAIQTTHLIFLL